MPVLNGAVVCAPLPETTTFTSMLKQTAMLLTFTITFGDVAVALVESVATATSVLRPLFAVFVSQLNVYGATVCDRAQRKAVEVVLDARYRVERRHRRGDAHHTGDRARPRGLAIVTVKVGSALATVKPTGVALATAFELSVTVALTLCAPLVRVVVSSATRVRSRGVRGTERYVVHQELDRRHRGGSLGGGCRGEVDRAGDGLSRGGRGDGHRRRPGR